MSFDARKTFWSFFPPRESLFNIDIFFVRLIRKIPTFFLGVTVETQENIIPKKVRQENILKFANTRWLNIQSKTFWSFRVLREEISLVASIFQGILTSNKWTRGISFWRIYHYIEVVNLPKGLHSIFLKVSLLLDNWIAPYGSIKVKATC